MKFERIDRLVTKEGLRFQAWDDRYCKGVWAALGTHELQVELSTTLAKLGIVLLLARAKDLVRTLLLKTAPDLFQEKLFWSVADAAEDAERLLFIMD